MACRWCNGDIFREKIGRCRTCMVQLLLLSIIGWPTWFILYAAQPTHVESIALLFFCCSFTGLLLIHLIVWAYRYITTGEN